MDTTNLNEELVGNLLKFSHLDAQLRESNMDRSTHSSAKVGRARRNVTKMAIVSEASHTLDVGSGLGETSENSTDVGTWLHRDNAKLVLFIDPDEEGLLVVVEDTSTFRPVAV